MKLEDIPSDISELFALAEEKIKLVQNLRGDITFPAVNQLRYVAFHLLRADRESDTSRKAEEFRKAKNHCERAIYDAVEAGIVHCLDKIRVFQQDYRTVVITNVVDDYVGMCCHAAEASQFISQMTRTSIGDHFDNRGDRYRESTELFEKLLGHTEVLACARPELNKRLLANHRDYIYRTKMLIIAVLALLIALAGLILVELRQRTKPTQSPRQTNTLSIPQTPSPNTPAIP